MIDQFFFFFFFQFSEPEHTSLGQPEASILERTFSKKISKQQIRTVLSMDIQIFQLPYSVLKFLFSPNSNKRVILTALSQWHKQQQGVSLSLVRRLQEKQLAGVHWVRVLPTLCHTLISGDKSMILLRLLAPGTCCFVASYRHGLHETRFGLQFNRYCIFSVNSIRLGTTVYSQCAKPDTHSLHCFLQKVIIFSVAHFQN